MTPYKNIYNRFTANITDYTFAQLEELQSKELMFQSLQKAIPKFIQCVQNLSDRDDTNENFNITLTELEEEILADLMTNEWTKHYMNHAEILEQKLGSKDYREYSPANLLKEIRELHSYSVSESDRLKVQYSYSKDLEGLS